ncbi:ATP-dependent RNA helicase DBP3 [Paracoccidioides lutzii Pb01]|uniref:RNA helicase n=1 Tax=Paracoccidioides lutzii (strain ATCC MYA-826 / Pb01) TaxID=502779 RepID=C1GP47_PARBA|nr:ATP-dependent RNA helicase DBP3 [Paracoccidioides lutzii Pb01]EEH35969.1 ATP-dependent RNA helicase DBP3 [Paracoccidioides lutzii Pb01]
MAKRNRNTESNPELSSRPTKRSKEDAKPKTPSYIQSPDLDVVSQSEIDDFLKSHAIQILDPLTKATLRPITEFSYLPSDSKELYGPLENFSKPTPIQSVSWPFLFAGRDVIGVAETGSGKTLAFGVPCIRKVLEINGPRSSSRISAVIITPTRELATQIYDQLMKFTPNNVGIACIYGGASKDDQRRALKKASVVVATTGRLKDFQGDESLRLDKVKYLVLDEADRMLDKGFEQDIKDIVGAMPSSKKRQTVMFTATWPISVRKLADTFMKDQVMITIGDLSSDIRANTRIKQIVEVLKPEDKEYRLLSLLNQYQRGKNAMDKVLVFCLYKKEATRIERLIRSKGFKVAGIHGDMNQTERFKSLDAFKSGAVPLLVATDVAARGLDIPAVRLVLNVTFPLTVEDYVHRIGRTGRAGADGLAITMFTENDKALSGGLVNILKRAKQEIPEALLKFGTTVKKKQHDSYGAFFREANTMKTATKIKFDD